MQGTPGAPLRETDGGREGRKEGAGGRGQPGVIRRNILPRLQSERKAAIKQGPGRDVGTEIRDLETHLREWGQEDSPRI